MLQFLNSQKDEFSPLTQRKFLNAVKGPVNNEEKTEKTWLVCSETADHAARLLTSEFFKHLHSLFQIKTMYALEADKLFEWSTVE